MQTSSDTNSYSHSVRMGQRNLRLAVGARANPVITATFLSIGYLNILIIATDIRHNEISSNILKETGVWGTAIVHLTRQSNARSYEVAQIRAPITDRAKVLWIRSRSTKFLALTVPYAPVSAQRFD